MLKTIYLDDLVKTTRAHRLKNLWQKMFEGWDAEDTVQEIENFIVARAEEAPLELLPLTKTMALPNTRYHSFSTEFNESNHLRRSNFLPSFIDAFDLYSYEIESIGIPPKLQHNYFHFLVTALHLGEYLHDRLRHGEMSVSLFRDFQGHSLKTYEEKTSKKNESFWMVKQYPYRTDTDLSGFMPSGVFSPLYQTRRLMGLYGEHIDVIDRLSIEDRIQVADKYLQSIVDFTKLQNISFQQDKISTNKIEASLYFSEALGDLYRLYLDNCHTDLGSEIKSDIDSFVENVFFAYKYFMHIVPNINPSVIKKLGFLVARNLEPDKKKLIGVYGEDNYEELSKVSNSDVMQLYSIILEEKNIRDKARKELFSKIEKVDTEVISISSLHKDWYYGFNMANLYLCLLGSRSRFEVEKSMPFLEDFVNSINSDVNENITNNGIDIYDIGALDGLKGLTFASKFETVFPESQKLNLHILDSSERLADWAYGFCELYSHESKINLFSSIADLANIEPEIIRKSNSTNLLMLMGQTLGNFEDYTSILDNLSTTMNSGDYLVLEIDTSKDINQWLEPNYMQSSIQFLDYIFEIDFKDLIGYDSTILGSGILTSYEGTFYINDTIIQPDVDSDIISPEILQKIREFEQEKQSGIRRYFVPEQDIEVTYNGSNKTLQASIPVHYATSLEFVQQELANSCVSSGLEYVSQHQDGNSLALLLKKSQLIGK